MTERWKDIFIMITLGVIAILATAYLIDILLIDGLSVDKSFLGSILGGGIGTVGVIATTYFLIEANKEQTLRAASMHDKTERDRYFLQLVITNSEDTLIRLSKLKDKLTEYKRHVSIANRQIGYCSRIVKRINQIYGDNTILGSDLQIRINALNEKKETLEESFVDKFNEVTIEQEQINEILIILNSRKDFYNGTILSDLYLTFRKYSYKIEQLFDDAIYVESNWEETNKRIKDIIDKDLESLIITVELAIDDLFSQIESAIFKLKEGTISN